MLDGYNWRRENLEKTASYFVSWLLAPHVKEPIQPLTILEGLRPDEVKAIKEKQRKEDEEYLKQLFPKALGGRKNGDNC